MWWWCAGLHCSRTATIPRSARTSYCVTFRSRRARAGQLRPALRPRVRSCGTSRRALTDVRNTWRLSCRVMVSPREHVPVPVSSIVLCGTPGGGWCQEYQDPGHDVTMSGCQDVSKSRCLDGISQRTISGHSTILPSPGVTNQARTLRPMIADIRL